MFHRPNIAGWGPSLDQSTRQASVSHHHCLINCQHGREIMLVHIANKPTKLFEFWVKQCVFDNGSCEVPSYFKPFRPFSPFGDGNFRVDVLVVAASADRLRVTNAPMKLGLIGLSSKLCIKTASGCIQFT